MPVKLENMRDMLLKGLWETGTGPKPQSWQITGGVNFDKKQKMSASGEFTLDEIEEARKFMYKCNQS